MGAYRVDAVQDAMARALKVRLNAGVQLSDPASPYQIAESLGAEVWFQAAPSMEGVFFRSPTPLIVLSTLRPRGRRTYTCAHELGHLVYNHGNRVDEAVERQTSDRDEVVADAFAGFLLMPKSLVARAFMLRGWDPATCTPQQTFIVAGWLDVGYATLIQHMAGVLRMVSASHAAELMRVAPQRIKSDFLDEAPKRELIIVDSHWYGRPIDAEVGDLIHVPPGTEVDGACLEHYRWQVEGKLLVATQPGICRIVRDETSWASFVRISRAGFTGRNRFRFLPEADDE